eukprot:CAMPEP_0115309732 /NCGR_PEP_ID=MMETSP0270-20121206/74411_1 /TAXON_ID=71861 /ORGANISM="Scrippsiella trochoidea, Strain CCMP3099" /LENGTH=178 /DNA_ID=CAMNT_0002728421 /DNA_START=159 /DNA_END=695 /DNA_ORIENTATION=-
MLVVMVCVAHGPGGARQWRWARGRRDVPQDHDLRIAAVAVRAHGGLKLDPVAWVEGGNLLVSLLSKQQGDVGVLAAPVLVPCGVHLDHHNVLGAYEQHVKTFTNDADLTLPLERPASVPLLKGTRCGRAVRQRGPRSAIEHEVLPCQHGRCTFVLFMCRVELYRRSQQVERDNHPQEA